MTEPLKRNIEHVLRAYEGTARINGELRSEVNIFYEHQENHDVYVAEMRRAALFGGAEPFVQLVQRMNPLLSLAVKYEEAPKSAESYFIEQLDKAKKLRAQVIATTKKVVPRLEDRMALADKQESRAATMSELEGVREEKDALLQQYAFLKKFSGQSCALEAAVGRQNACAQLFTVLDMVAQYASREPSPSVMSTLSYERSRLVAGRVFDGDLRKKAKGCKEGVLRCDELVKEIDNYVAHPEQARCELAVVRDQHEQLVRQQKALGKYVSGKASAECLPLLDGSYVPYSTVFGSYLRKENARIAKEVSSLAVEVEKHQYAVAKKELAKLSVRVPQGTIDAKITHVEKTMKRVSELSRLFVGLEASELAECEAKKVELSRVYVSLKTKCVLVEKVVASVPVSVPTFFSRVADMECPQSPDLRKLRNELLHGSLHDRLVALRSFAENKELTAQDKVWKIQLRKAFEQDRYIPGRIGEDAWTCMKESLK